MSYKIAAHVDRRLDAIPAHVPPELVVDFDYFNPPGVADDPHMAFKRLHDGPDLVYTPWNGGHWIVTRADDLFAVLHDTVTYSSTEFTIPKLSPGSPPLIPNRLDPPEHGPMRSIVLRPLSPKAIRPVEPMIRKVIAARIAAIAPKGRCEFVSEFTDVPPELFFEFAGIPKDAISTVKHLADTIVRNTSEDERREARLAVWDYLGGVLEDARRGPGGDDLFSVIIAHERTGQITPEESTAIAQNVFLGGLETVASALAFIVLFLARSPTHRKQLIDDPTLCQDATEELLRRFGILNLARIATRRTTLSGVTIEAGEQLLIPYHLANLDERKFPNPMEVDFHRERVAHFGFGTGVHRCVGSNLARPEIRIFLEEWLRLIPDFSVDPDDKPVGGSGIAMTMTRVPLVWPSR